MLQPHLNTLSDLMAGEIDAAALRHRFLTLPREREKIVVFPF